MTKNEKDLLLKDLCARLPYGVKGEKYTIRIDGEFVPHIDVEIMTAEDIITLNGCPGYMIKPYLFPLSSMTEEQKRDLRSLFKCCIIIKQYEIEFPNYEDSNMDNWIKVFTWCYKNHIDIYGLIPMGLAIDATGLNIY